MIVIAFILGFLLWIADVISLLEGDGSNILLSWALVSI